MIVVFLKSKPRVITGRSNPISVSVDADSIVYEVDEYHIAACTFSSPLSSMIMPTYGVWLHRGCEMGVPLAKNMRLTN